MSYVESNLLPNEKIVYWGHIHWAILLPCVPLFLASGLAAWLAVANGLDFLRIVALVLALVGFVMLVHKLVFMWVTELALTSQRVIARFGFLHRNTIEMAHRKAESIEVDQSPLGRLLNFGSLKIHGMGGATTPIPWVKDPLLFRMNVLKMQEEWVRLHASDKVGDFSHRDGEAT